MPSKQHSTLAEQSDSPKTPHEQGSQPSRLPGGLPPSTPTPGQRLQDNTVA